MRVGIASALLVLGVSLALYAQDGLTDRITVVVAPFKNFTGTHSRIKAEVYSSAGEKRAFEIDRLSWNSAVRLQAAMAGKARVRLNGRKIQILDLTELEEAFRDIEMERYGTSENLEDQLLASINYDRAVTATILSANVETSKMPPTDRFVKAAKVQIVVSFKNKGDGSGRLKGEKLEYKAETNRTNRQEDSLPSDDEVIEAALEKAIDNAVEDPKFWEAIQAE